MMDFFNAVSAVLMLFALMAVGYVMGCLGWMGPGEKKFVSRFVVNVAVPLNCVAGLLNNFSHDALVSAGKMMISAIVGILSTLVLSALAATALRLPWNRWGVFTAMAGTSNTLFIGLPLTNQLFGEISLPYMMVYYLSSAMITQSLVVLLVERSGTTVPRKLRLWDLVRDIFTKPPILGVLTGVLLLVMDLRPPEQVMKFSQYIGDTVTPLALMYCGFIVYEVGLRNLRFLKGIPTMLVIRLVISPIICLGMCTLTGITGLARSVFIVESALPVVTQITVMAGAYGADEEYAATGACMSMLGCFFTIPVLMLLLG